MASAQALVKLESQLESARQRTSARLLSLRSLSRAWSDKQHEMDRALAPFGPQEIYKRLGEGVREQDGLVRAVEESFLEGEGIAAEREVQDVIRRVREGIKRGSLRRERRARWDEGRVGGWR